MLQVMKRLILILIMTLGMAAAAAGQSFSLSYAKEMPSFNGGGIAAFTQQVQDALVYPESIADGREGTVTVGFFISKDGKLLMSKVLKGMDEAFDKEALKAVRSIAGTWTPALDESGNPLDWYVTVRITFKKPEHNEQA